MGISEEKMKIVINNYFKSECNVNTSIREAFEKGFRIGVKKGLAQSKADTPQTDCDKCIWSVCNYNKVDWDADTPQTDCYVSDLCKHYGDKQICGRCRNRNLFCEAEPQPRCPKCGKRGYIRSLESMGVKLKVFDEYRWKCTNCNKYFKEEPKDKPQTDLPEEEFVEGMKNLKMEVKQTDCGWK